MLSQRKNLFMFYETRHIRLHYGDKISATAEKPLDFDCKHGSDFRSRGKQNLQVMMNERAGCTRVGKAVFLWTSYKKTCFLQHNPSFSFSLDSVMSIMCL